jgi:hypothetical protein
MQSYLQWPLFLPEIGGEADVERNLQEHRTANEAHDVVLGVGDPRPWHQLEAVEQALIASLLLPPGFYLSILSFPTPK